MKVYCLILANLLINNKITYMSNNANPLSVSSNLNKDKLLSSCILILLISYRLQESICLREASLNDILWQDDPIKKPNQP